MLENQGLDARSADLETGKMVPGGGIGSLKVYQLDALI